jgi:hypothetical protein
MFMNPGLDGMTVCQVYTFSHFQGLMLAVPDHLHSTEEAGKFSRWKI